jgi:hypothetical protein
MNQIPLAVVPNQSISFNVDGAYWQLRIYQTANFMCADVLINGTPVVNSVLCLGGIPLMQYAYMYAPNFGNFIFDSDADWTNFGTSCNLYYLENSELQQFNELLSG